MLFYGPPGTGKTSVILALAHDLFGPEMFKARVMELNASDERGINTIREKVKKFAQQTIAQKPASCLYPCPPFKIIILDEADSLTTEAQNALRRVMEVFTRLTRFCLICNYVSKYILCCVRFILYRIVDPIASRCAKFRFTPLQAPVAFVRLKEICEKENVICGEEVFLIFYKK
jgi:replication factor C subunit 2/4